VSRFFVLLDGVSLSINKRFSYLLTYLLTGSQSRPQGYNCRKTAKCELSWSELIMTSAFIFYIYSGLTMLHWNPAIMFSCASYAFCNFRPHSFASFSRTETDEDLLFIQAFSQGRSDKPPSN